MVYTENPYIDIIIYNTKLLGINTVLKMQGQAENGETEESLKHADMLIMCTEGTVIFKMFDSFSEEVLRSAGLIGIPLANALANPNAIPENLRDRVTALAAQEFIENYEDLNPYYRMLSGLPPVGHEDYITNWTPPDGIQLDLSVPVHKMSDAAINILKNEGVLDDMYDEDHENRAYMKYLDRKIDPYTARRASQFSVLYIPSIDSAEIEKEYRDRLEANKEYVLKAVYSYAYKWDSDYYDNIMAVFIVLNAMMDVLLRVQEFIARKEVFDLRTCEYIFDSYGVDFFPTIPLRYQVKMVKNLHTLLKYKSTSKCMVDICSLFGFDNIQIFKYYLLRTHNQDKVTHEYSFTGDVNVDYDLKFVKIPIDEPMADYIRDPANYLDYDEITMGDPTWDGGLEHDYVKEQHLEWEFNYSRTKYLSIDSIYDIATISAQQSYFFNMLYDNYELEDLLLVSIPAITDEKQFKLADIFTFLTCLTHYFYGNKDLILDTQGKILYVNGFNFKADLAALSEALWEMRFDKEAQELLKQFNIPTESIPSISTLMNIFVNNLEVRDLLLAGMRNADSLKHYRPFKLLYDALMKVELTFDHFKNPETGDFYRDSEGDATYSAYLQAVEPILYYKLVEVQLIEDDDNRVNTIVNLIDNICYILEEWIDSDVFQGIFYGLPGVSSEAVKQYIMMVVNFYMSYKAHILGINTIYYYDDPNEGYIHVIDDMYLNRWLEKDETVALIDRFLKTQVNLERKEKIHLLEQVYFDIWTWKHYYPEDGFRTDIILSDIYHLITVLYKDDGIEMPDEVALINVIMDHGVDARPIDYFGNMTSILVPRDRVLLNEMFYIKREYPDPDAMVYVTFDRSKHFYINNIEVPTGISIINDDRVDSECTATFIADSSVYNLYSNAVSCTCGEGTIELNNLSDIPILGIIEVTKPDTSESTEDATEVTP